MRVLAGLAVCLAIAACGKGVGVPTFLDSGTPDVSLRDGGDTTIEDGSPPLDVPVDAQEVQDHVSEVLPETEDGSGDQDDASSCSPPTAAVGCPCTENADCLSGWCVQHLGGKICTDTCLEDCPSGFSCEMVEGFGPDPAFVCLSLFPSLCLPCATDQDCATATGQKVLCLAYGDEEGSFCGGNCGTDGDCPPGYSCEEASLPGGETAPHCVPAGGECGCTGYAEGWSTPCAKTNQWGTCTGTRICLEGMMTTCSADEPAEEICDGEDNDCDGFMDELVDCDDGDECTTDSCQGTDGCLHEPLTGTSCFDGSKCTQDDHCADGICVGEPVVCDDVNDCTDDTCDPVEGCVFEENQDPCDDGSACTEEDICTEGLCVGLTVECDDQDDCTMEWCDPETGCQYEVVQSCLDPVLLRGGFTSAGGWVEFDADSMVFSFGQQAIGPGRFGLGDGGVSVGVIPFMIGK